MFSSCSIPARLTALALFSACIASHASAEAPKVELLVRGTADFKTHYDYVTWAPAPAVIRVTPQRGLDPNAQIKVVLTNEKPPTSGYGHVNFGVSPGDYKYALDNGAGNLDTITLSVKADGTPLRFVIAGAFPYFSRDDKDTVIVAHEGSASGPVLGKATLMVRVRRNEETLTEAEKQRFLWALAALRFRKSDTEDRSVYDFLVNMHDIGARGAPNGPVAPPDAYPDQEHKAAGFLPWHRAFLLELERDLQEVDPAVTLPYWPMYATPNGKPAAVFHEDFTGENSIIGGDNFFVPELIRFTVDNPLYGWNIVGRGPLMRWSVDRAKVAQFSKPGDLIDKGRPDSPRGRYAFVAGAIESNPHNIGHNWSGVWMSNCRISPSDPMFWPFHTYFDWLWAAWQQHYGRLNRDGQNKADYWPNDAYSETSGTKQIPVGHHLLDTMWPWNEEIQPTPVPAFNSRRPPLRAGGKFAPADIAGLWPRDPATPTPGDMIDYAGYADSADDLGVAYDNIPWSPKQAMPPFPGNAEPNADAMQALLDPRVPTEMRVEASKLVDLAQVAENERLAAVQAMALNADNPPALKIAALALLGEVDTSTAVETAYKMDAKTAEPNLRRAIEGVRELRMFASRPIDAGAKSVAASAAIAPAAAGLDPSLYRNARNNVPDNDQDTVARMTEALDKFLSKPNPDVNILPQDAAAFIAATNVLEEKSDKAAEHAMHMGAEGDSFSRERTIAVLRKLITATPVPVGPEIDWWKAKALAATALADDHSVETARLVLTLTRTTAAPLDTRVAALNSLRRNDAPEFERIAFALARNRADAPALRANAVAAIGAYITDHGVTLQPNDRKRLHEGLQQLRSASLPPPALAALQTATRLLALAEH